MDAPDDLRYSSDHEWVRFEGTIATVGITDFAQDSLGDVVYVDLPDVGAELAVSDTFGEVESTKSVSDLFSPVSGTVIEVNAALEDAPQRLNEAPYTDGWICKIEVGEGDHGEDLMDAAAYQALTEG